MFIVLGGFVGECGPEFTVLFTSTEELPTVQNRVRDYIAKEYSSGSIVSMDNEGSPMSWHIIDPRLELPEYIDIKSCIAHF